MDEDQLRKVEGTTGKLPLFLDRLLDAPSRDFEAAYKKLLSDELIKDIPVQLDSATAAALKVHKERHIQALMACVLGTVPEVDRNDVYDHRYMYFDEESKGHCVNDLVRDCVTTILRKLSSEVFSDPGWLHMCRTTDNPSIRGFMAEQIVITEITLHGLCQVLRRVLKPADSVVFRTGTEGSILVLSSGCVVYIPHAFNYKAIDLLLREITAEKDQQKKVLVAPIQISLQKPEGKKREKSIDGFFPLRHAWLSADEVKEAEVEWHFIWITQMKHRSVEHEASTKAGGKVQLPAYTEHFLSFEQVCPDLAFLCK